MKIGFIGTGLLGYPMCKKVVEASGLSVFIWNRTKAKTKGLEASNATICDSAAQVFDNADAILVMVTDGPAVRDIVLGGVTLKDKLVVQMSTIGIEESKEISAKVQAEGGKYVESPVLGSVPQAESSNLIVMTAGDKTLLDPLQPVFASFGKKILHVSDEIGPAAALKLSMNNLIPSLLSAFSLSLGMCEKAGVPTDMFLDVLRSSAFYAPTFDAKLPMVSSREFNNTHFIVRHMLKDMNLVLETAKSCGLDESVAQGVADILKKSIENGDGDKDYSALVNTVYPKKKE